MQRRSARLRFFASGLALVYAWSCSPSQASDELDQSALAKPQVIADWLSRNSAAADRKMAASHLDFAVKAQAQRRWGPAGKAFGDSALNFPTPAALIGYADNGLRDIAGVRARAKDSSHTTTDLNEALAVYRSALAAEAQLKMLTAPALAQLKSDEACLAAFLANPNPSLKNPPASACRPLELYREQ